MSIRKLLILSVIAVSVVEAIAAKKYIFSSWELGDLTPDEILAHADAFDKTGCDGLSFAMLRTLLPGADGRHHRHVIEEPRWTDEELNKFAPVFSELAKHPSMKNSFFLVNAAPRKERLGWADDVAWSRFADSLSAVARLAKKVGFALPSSNSILHQASISEMFTLDSALQFWKALRPIFVTVLGIVMLVRAVHPLNV